MIKKLLTIIVLIMSTLAVDARDEYGHSLEKLWKDYYKAYKKDLPQDQIRILESIMEQAGQERLAWDFYDACDKYARTKSSSNWKLRDEAQKHKTELVEKFAVPIAVYADMNSRYINPLERFSYIQEHKEELQKDHNPGFYSLDESTFGLALALFIDNDYDYVLWDILLESHNAEPILAVCEERFASRYPHDALLRWTQISPSDFEALTLFERDYKDKAVALYASESLLNYRFDQLEKKDGRSQEYVDLANDAKRVVAQIAAYKGYDKNLLSECDEASELLKTLNSKAIRYKIKDRELTIYLQNLSDCNLTVRKGKNQILEKTLLNDKKSFYAQDSLKFTLPKLLDGDYKITLKSGKIKHITDYSIYSLSIASRKHSEGIGIYITDSESGEPISGCDIYYYESDGKLLDSIDDFQVDGFTSVPEDFLEKMKYRWGNYLQAAYTDKDGSLRLSPKLILYNSRSLRAEAGSKAACQILMDRKAFKPGENLQFKAVLYYDFGSFELMSNATCIANLYDASDKLLSSKELVSNDFGSVASSFELPKSDKAGRYSIEIVHNAKSISREYFVVDEFVLPSFEIVWDNNERHYFPGDLIRLSGQVKAYSGHTLSSALCTYIVSINGDTQDAKALSLDDKGRFVIELKALSGENPNRYSVVLKVSDSTGETLESRQFASSDEHIYYSPNILESEQADVSIDSEDCTIVKSSLKLDLSTRYPGSFVQYELLCGDSTIYNGIVRGEEAKEVILDLKDYESGIYTLRLCAKYESDDGKEYQRELEKCIYLIRDEDEKLNASFDHFFRDIDSDMLSVQLGVCDAPLWIVAELYSKGDKLLASKMVFLDELNSLQEIGFPRLESYYGQLTLKLFYFKNRKHQLYSREFDLPILQPLPLSFTRFLDTTAPSSEYTFIIHTQSDVECAASIYDISSETIMRNRWGQIYPTLPYRYVDYNIESGYITALDDLPVGDYVFRSLKRSTSVSPLFLESNAIGCSDDMDCVESPAMLCYDGAESEILEETMDGETESDVKVRSDFASTLAWEPFLRSDNDGDISFSFKTADQLSRYKVQLFAHDIDLRTAVLSKEMTVTLPVKVSLVQPQYIYESDKYVARMSVVNSSDTDVQGEIYLQIKGGKKYGKRVLVKAGSSADYSHTIAVSGDVIGLYAGFKATDSKIAGDAVYVEIPVLKAMQTIRESHSELVLSSSNKQDVIARLRKQFVNLDGATALAREISIRDMLLEAIPANIEPSSENVIELVDALYSRYLLSTLKDYERDDNDLINKILACKTGLGGFSWYAGMAPSPVITAAVLRRLFDLGESCPKVLKATVPAAAQYLDRIMLGMRSLPYWCGWISVEQYLAIRANCSEVAIDVTMADKKRLSELRKKVREYLLEEALNAQIAAKAQRICTLEAMIAGDSKFAAFWPVSQAQLKDRITADLASLEQYAQPHSLGGYYFPNAVMPFRGLLESELHAHAQLCGIMERYGFEHIAQGVRLWIMVQKETQEWHQDPAYMEALATVLKGGEDLLNTCVIELSASGTLPFAKLKASGNGFTVESEYYRDGKLLKDGDKIDIGDKIVAKYKIWNEENRSFVRLIAPRPAAMRPVNQLSGLYAWWMRPLRVEDFYSLAPQGYRSVRAEQSEYCFDSYPEENTTIEEELFVTQEGSFVAAVPTIECLYSPHYRANGTSRFVIVK